MTAVTLHALLADPGGTLQRVEAAYERATRWPRERSIAARERLPMTFGQADSGWSPSQRVS